MFRFICLEFICSDYITDLIKKLELCLTVVSVFLNIRFGHAQISIPMSKQPVLIPGKGIIKLI